jgi:hypothetical protein
MRIAGQNVCKRRRVVVAGTAIAFATGIAGCGGSSHSTGATSSPAAAPATAQHASTPTPAPRTLSRAKTATSPGKVNLSSPSGSKTTAALAEVLKQGNNASIAIVGHGLPANTKHNAYAVWLYNTPGDAVRLGFVNPGVGKNGHLATTGPLPTNAAHFKQLLITVETTTNPQQPGPIILRGNLTGV